MGSVNKNNNRRSFVLLIVVFGLPILIAKLALEYQWLNYGVTNQGELIVSPFTTDDIDLATVAAEKQWLLTYRLAPDCDEYCQQLLAGINNTYIALGKEMPRVTPIALYQNVLTPSLLENVKKNDWRFIEATPKAENKLDAGKLYIVDPLGNIFLTHTLPNNAADIPAFGKAVLADMKKLLKYSKVG